MSKLSEELAKYYKRVGGRIVFTNGETLNQLAISLWEKLNYKEVDVSVLSRVIKGERLFTHSQLQVFCTHLHLTQVQYEKLRRALSNDILLKHNIEYLPVLDLKSDSTLLPKLPNIIKSLRDTGSLDEAISLGIYFESNLENQHKLGKEYKQILANLYNQRARTYGYIANKNNALVLMSSLNQKALALGEEIGDTTITGMAHINVGGSHYLAHNWKFSSQYLAGNIYKVNTKTRLEFLRTLLLDYAYVNDYQNFRYSIKRVFKLLEYEDSFDSDTYLSVLEATSRGLSMFGLTKAARSLLNETDNVVGSDFYKSQVIRGKAMTYYYDVIKGRKVDKDEIIKLHSLSCEPRYAVYKRHQQQIKKVLQYAL